MSRNGNHDDNAGADEGAADAIFRRLGGLPGITRIALALYDRVTQSERLECFFAGVDMRRLVDHQARFLASLVGGPASVTDEELKAVHARLGIDRETFLEMLEQFRQVLEDHQAEPADTEHVLAELARREPCIVTRRNRKGGSRVA